MTKKRPSTRLRRLGVALVAAFLAGGVSSASTARAGASERSRLGGARLGIRVVAPSRRTRPSARLSYSIALDPAHPDTIDVAIGVRGAGRSFRLAMAVHPEYDDRYWRYLDGLHVEDGHGASGGTVTREDSTLWRVTLAGDEGVIRYRVHVVPPEPGAFAGSWRPFFSPTGALLNGPDLLLYLPDFARAPATLDLRMPAEWHTATGLAAGRVRNRFVATGAAELLDAPVLLGMLHTWGFRERGVSYRIVYLPAPQATPFDSVAVVRELRDLVRATVDVFGSAPSPNYVFLLRDGAGGALEHHNSVTIGVSSAQLARDPGAILGEVAVEVKAGRLRPPRSLTHPAPWPALPSAAAGSLRRAPAGRRRRRRPRRYGGCTRARR